MFDVGGKIFSGMFVMGFNIWVLGSFLDNKFCIYKLYNKLLLFIIGFK